MASASATQHSFTTMRLPILCYMRCLLFLLTVATVNRSSLADHSSPPSTLVLYAHRKIRPPDQTIVAVASPSGNLSVTEFGTTFVVGDILRETEAADSPVLGSIKGQVVAEEGNSIYLAGTYALNTTSFAGSVSVQGATTPEAGEGAITGGTQDFRFARGYVDAAPVFQDSQVLVFKLVLHINYH